jgi:hypothetical protein
MSTVLTDAKRPAYEPLHKGMGGQPSRRSIAGGIEDAPADDRPAPVRSGPPRTGVAPKLAPIPPLRAGRGTPHII